MGEVGGESGESSVLHRMQWDHWQAPPGLSSSDTVGRVAYAGRVGNLEAERGTAKRPCVPLEIGEGQAEWRKGLSVEEWTLHQQASASHASSRKPITAGQSCRLYVHPQNRFPNLHSTEPQFNNTLLGDAMSVLGNWSFGEK